jgi:tetratricopeptide (TPR) repeat protein
MTLVVFTLVMVLATAAIAAPAPPDVQAKILLTSGRVDDAISTFTRRVQANPNDAEAWNLLGRVYYSFSRWDDAINALQHATALQPTNSEFHMWLGRAYGEKADDSGPLTGFRMARKTRDELERAVQLDGNNVAARSDLAEYYTGAPGIVGGGKDKALAQADAIGRIDPPQGHYIRAMVASKEGNYQMAEQELKAAINSAVNKAKYWINLASFYRGRQRYQDMEIAINNAVGASGAKAAALFDGADMLNRTGRNLNGAAQMLHDYIASDAHVEDAPVFQAHYLLGSVLQKLGDKQAAAEQYRIALSLAQGFQKAQDALRNIQ